MLFWLMGAPDGHTKNRSIFLTLGARYRLTSFYDVLTTQPAHDPGPIRRIRFKLARSVSGHYRMDEVAARRHAARPALRPRRVVLKNPSRVCEVILRCRSSFC